MTDVREITRSALIFESSVMRSSVMPSAKYSCSGSPDRFSSGRTASARMGGPGSEGETSRDRYVQMRTPIPRRDTADAAMSARRSRPEDGVGATAALSGGEVAPEDTAGSDGGEPPTSSAIQRTSVLNR